MSGGGEWSVLRRSTTPFGQVHQERIIRTYRYNECVNTLGALASPIFHEKLSEEERCARISTVKKKKTFAQNLYDAYVATLTGYSPDDDDLKELKIRHDALHPAMWEVSKLELCPL
ncbi:hypothetical protein CEXT_351241 [Caerostris extrusa]|uniref:Uncharacterized protein n=1 Tax=Caerostris extrusa TaxID=172846 RepID=A0AAV4XBT5_CAEEX|nr:hypothetical protein CEXT_351241 [Caerostris extrusa]